MHCEVQETPLEPQRLESRIYITGCAVAPAQC